MPSVAARPPSVKPRKPRKRTAEPQIDTDGHGYETSPPCIFSLTSFRGDVNGGKGRGSPHVRVIHECKKCSFGRHIPEKDIPEIIEGIRRTSRSALDALLAGEKQFEEEKGEKTNCAAYLAETIKLLHGLNAEEDLQRILAALQEHNLAHAAKIAGGQMLELQGHLAEAAEAYMEAAKSDPNDMTALVALGSVYVIKKDLDWGVSNLRKDFGTSFRSRQFRSSSYPAAYLQIAEGSRQSGGNIRAAF